MAISPYCLPCERYDRWIEIDVRDERNRSFQGLKATLTDDTGNAKTVTLKDGPTLVEGFAVGPVTVKLETQAWLKAAQSREALKEGETAPVPAYTEKYLGHNDVTRITDDATGKQIAPNFTELALPGCHSDIGGGYYSRWSLRNPNSDPALTEQKAIKLFQSMEPAGSRPEKSVAYQRAMDYAQAKLSQGWGNGVSVLPTPASDPLRGKVSLRVRTLNRPEFGREKPLEVSVTVLLNRVVEGEYSRIPLHIMVEAARAAGVPFQEWKADNRALMLESGAPMRPRVDLAKLDGHWVNAGTEAGIAKDLSQQLPDEVYRYLRFEYLHHSADDGMVNGANHIKGQEARRLISNPDGGK